jgi:MFS family permease
VSSYALAFGCFLLLWGRIADIYGKRFIFIAGSFWVTAVNAANPFLPNEIAFDLFRGLHGLVSLTPSLDSPLRLASSPLCNSVRDLSQRRA